MKKQILSLAFVAALIGSVATGCSSMNETTGSDSTVVDSTSTTTKPDTMTKTDTVKTDTTKKM